MGTRKTGKTKKWEIEHSLPSTHYGHYCKECRHFHSKFPSSEYHGMLKNYCTRQDKKMKPTTGACSRFGIRGQPKVKVGLIAERMMKMRARANRKGSAKNQGNKYNQSQTKGCP